jgi:DNA-binding NarL/FixJ family response regulator
MPRQINVLICNSQSLLREGVKALFREGSSIEIVGETGNGSDAITLAARLRPDVVLMDAALPDLSGHEATRRIREISPNTKVLILTMYEDDHLITRCLEAGASGYMRKDAHSDQLAEAINIVSEGGEYQSPRAA